MKPTRSPISAVIGVVTSQENPDKLSGDWCVYASSASSSDNLTQSLEAPLLLSKFASSDVLKNVSFKLKVDMSDRIFQFLPNTRNVINKIYLKKQIVQNWYVDIIYSYAHYFFD